MNAVSAPAKPSPPSTTGAPTTRSSSSSSVLSGSLFDPYTSTFLLAGPVKLHPRIQQAMAAPSLNHRGEYFHGLVHEIKELLPLVFGQKGNQVVLSGSGTAGLEAMVSGLVKKNEKVVVVSNGHFGDRMEKLVDRFGQLVPVRAPWGKPVSLELLKATLEQNSPKAVAMVYNETSVGFTNALESVGTLAKKHEALFLVDAISALPGLPTPGEAAQVDAIVVGSQKGLAAPPGLALVHLSERAKARLAPQTFYNDLAEHVKSLEKDDTPFTPAVPLFLALREALLLLKEEGVERRQARTRLMAEATRAAVKAMGLSLFPEEPFASNTVTAIRYPTGVEDSAFRAALRDRHNVIVSGGQGQAKGQIFRIGHMGIASFGEVLTGIAAVEREMFRMGKVAAMGPGVSAFEALLP
ncbi:MAG: alanine--glyoxylate aminotransferase family protein [Euryarchaeota archaeon]|nr:alanine--glyoxylate aminotransferase family protein [Euryarchaeota archaeon]MDE1837280.1 alanine--glyoxylate aminotransferase family protein [Euryarchaeota archaeon]MDE1879950.1 alanine--glyoxylate aminotransferase family protein [Euryarchaeota archaeon]MDE2045116.1 alanine--glyoxylate aminotransferase family protein [Thermoplasmata archaeon]